MDAARKFYDALASQLQEARAIKMAQFGEVRVVSPASMPQYPASQGKLKSLVLAGIFSLVMGVFLAFFMEFGKTGKR